MEIPQRCQEHRTHPRGRWHIQLHRRFYGFPGLIDQPKQNNPHGEGGTSPSRFKHIIKTDKGYRRLLPIELERLNGFPDDWTQTDANGGTISDVRRSFFMGNALVIGLIEKVGKVIADEF